MSYFGALSALPRTEQRAQLTLDIARAGRTPTQARAAAGAILTPKPAPTTSPMFDLCPAARPVAQRLSLTPTRAVYAVETVRDAQQPGMTAAAIATLTGLSLDTVQVVLEVQA